MGPTGKITGSLALLATLYTGAARAAVDFISSTVTVLETDGTATLSIIRTGAGTDAANITIVATHGTAAPNTDYSFQTTTVSWNANETGTKSVSIPLLQDTIAEGTETAYFALTNVTGDALGSQQTIQLVITDPNLAISGDQGLTEEQRDAAQVLDEVCGQASTNILGCDLLSELNDAQQAQALETILPRQVVQQASNSMVAQTGNTQAIQQRMQNVRAGNTAPLANFMLLSGEQAVALDTLTKESLATYRGGSAGDEVLHERWGVFLSGQIQTADQDSTTEILGYQSDSQQITGGFDYRFGARLFIGSAFSYSQTETESNADAGKQDSETTIANLYTSYYFTDNLYLDVVASMGRSDYDMSRNYRFGSTIVAADSNTSGDQWGVSAALGMDLSFGAWLLDGVVRAETRQLTIDSYSETGGAGLALAVGEQNVDSNQTTLGGSVGRVFSATYGVWVPKLTLEWVHELADESRDISAHFVAKPDAGTFALATVEPDRDYINAAGTLIGTFKHGQSAYMRYQAVLERADFMAETYELGFRLAF